MENLAQSLFQLFTSLSNISKYKSMGFIIALGFISYRECFIKIPSTVLRFHLLQSIVRRWVIATPFLRHPLPFIQHASLYSFRFEHKFMFKHMTNLNCKVNNDDNFEEIRKNINPLSSPLAPF